MLFVNCLRSNNSWSLRFLVCGGMWFGLGSLLQPRQARTTFWHHNLMSSTKLMSRNSQFNYKNGINTNKQPNKVHPNFSFSLWLLCQLAFVALLGWPLTTKCSNFNSEVIKRKPAPGLVWTLVCVCMCAHICVCIRAYVCARMHMSVSTCACV